MGALAHPPGSQPSMLTASPATAQTATQTGLRHGGQVSAAVQCDLVADLTLDCITRFAKDSRGPHMLSATCC